MGERFITQEQEDKLPDEYKNGATTFARGMNMLIVANPDEKPMFWEDGKWKEVEPTDISNAALKTLGQEGYFYHENRIPPK